MKKVGIDISKQRPKDTTEDMMRSSSKIVNRDVWEKRCPTMFVPNLLYWGIEDRKGKSIEMVRETRNEIEERVKGLTASLPKENQPIDVYASVSTDLDLII